MRSNGEEMREIGELTVTHDEHEALLTVREEAHTEARAAGTAHMSRGHADVPPSEPERQHTAPETGRGLGSCRWQRSAQAARHRAQRAPECLQRWSPRAPNKKINPPDHSILAV